MKFSKKLISVIMAVVLVITLFPMTFASAKTVTESTGTFKCAWFNETLTYPYDYSDEYFSGSSYDYNHELATYSLCVAMASFNSFDKKKGDEHIAALLNECGYEVHSYGYETEDYDTVAVAFGRKIIDNYTVIIAAIRSGNYGMEWGGNLRVGSGDGDHEGFRIAADKLIGYFNEYFHDYPCDGSVKLLIPGYSRGASIANLTAAALDDQSYVEVLDGAQDYIDDVKIDELYAYTFEAPQCTTSTDTKNIIYSNIFNIVNPNDYVPMFVMDEWGFSLYGVRVEIPGADNCADYDSYYNRVCAEFDSFMGENGRKSSGSFYDKKHSLSAQTTLNHIFSDLATDVMKSRDYFHENYEDPMVFFAGQYLGKKRKAKDFLKTMGLITVATAVAVKSDNYDKIKSDGYKEYLAEYLAQKNGGELTQKQIEQTINLLTVLLGYINANRKDVVSLVDQLKMVAQVHQPFVALSWMRSLKAEDISAINGSFNPILRLSCTTVTLKKGINGRIAARHDEKGGHIEWSSDDESLVSVNDNGEIYGNDGGTATVTAVLYSESGEPLAKSNVRVTIKLNTIQTAMKLISSATSKS